MPITSDPITSPITNRNIHVDQAAQRRMKIYFQRKAATKKAGSSLTLPQINQIPCAPVTERPAREFVRRPKVDEHLVNCTAPLRKALGISALWASEDLVIDRDIIQDYIARSYVGSFVHDDRKNNTDGSNY